MSTGQNKNCGKCEKVVYPAEEIKCLDKVSSSTGLSPHISSRSLLVETTRRRTKVKPSDLRGVVLLHSFLLISGRRRAKGSPPSSPLFSLLVLAQRLSQMYRLRNDAEREERQRLRQDALLPRVRIVALSRPIVEFLLLQPLPAAETDGRGG